MEMMEDAHGPDYEFYQLFTSPADVGHFACSRSRTYVIGAHRERTTLLHDPWQLHDAIKDHISNKVATRPSDYLVATAVEVELEAMEKARVRRVTYRPGAKDLSYLLTTRERDALFEYEQKYLERFGVAASTNEDLFVFLGDNPSWSLTWSANGKLPTYRMNPSSGIYWNCKYTRWLTAKERLVSLGWPVIPEVAEEMQVPMIGAMDAKRASDLAGNSMHFLCTGVQQLIALACFAPADVCAAFL